MPTFKRTLRPTPIFKDAITNRTQPAASTQRLTRVRSIGIFPTIIARPRMRAVSQMIEPTAFPRAMLPCPLILAKTETQTSGSVVPRLRTVAPMIKRGILNFKDNSTAASTITSADVPRASRAAMKLKMRKNQCVC